jgi:hypothetical protein
MTRYSPFIAAFALTLAGGVAAEPSAQAPGDGDATAPRICRGAVRTVSSRIRTPRRCRTAEQWREEDEAASRLPISAQVTGGQNDGRAPAQPR